MKDVPEAIEAAWKIESTRLIAAIDRVTHAIGVAEELAQEALVPALELWPEEGISEHPGAGLMPAANGAPSIRPKHRVSRGLGERDLARGAGRTPPAWLGPP